MRSIPIHRFNAALALVKYHIDLMEDYFAVFHQVVGAEGFGSAKRIEANFESVWQASFVSKTPFHILVSDALEQSFGNFGSRPHERKLMKSPER